MGRWGMVSPQTGLPGQLIDTDEARPEAKGRLDNPGSGDDPKVADTVTNTINIRPK